MQKSNPILYLLFPHRLTGEQAFMTALFLESIVRSLWRVYGDDMADFQGRVFPDDPWPWADAYCKQKSSNDDEDF